MRGCGVSGQYSFDYVCRYYGVPARRGGRVTFRGEPGRITSGAGHYIRIRLDGWKRSILVHPTWEMIYDDARLP
jgi:hypothetical protein